MAALIIKLMLKAKVFVSHDVGVTNLIHCALCEQGESLPNV